MFQFRIGDERRGMGVGSDPIDARRAEKAERLATKQAARARRSPIARHDQALLAVVHPKGPDRAAAVDLLHAEQTGRVRIPVIEPLGPDADVAERGQFRRLRHVALSRDAVSAIRSGGLGDDRVAQHADAADLHLRDVARTQ